MGKIFLSNQKIEDIKIRQVQLSEKHKELLLNLSADLEALSSAFIDSDSETMRNFLEDISKKYVWLLDGLNELENYLSEAVLQFNIVDEEIANKLVS